METALCDATCLDSLAEKVHGAARDGMMVTLHAVLHNREEHEVQEVLQRKVLEEGQNTTPFLIAARNGHTGVVRMLLQDFHIDIEQTGTVKFDGYTIEGATALWCASGAGHFDIVRLLVESGADVNHTTCTNSTPLRAACFDGRLEIVKYLIDHKADVSIPNKYDNTCLMIACYRGHCDVVSCLLEHHADPDAKAHCGATALHFAAERGHLNIVKELMVKNATVCMNDHGLSPLHIAAESSKADIVEFFISHENCSKLNRIEALELLGASYANDKDSYNTEKAYLFMWLAMQERYSEPSNVLHKNIQPSVAAYDNHVESKNVAELESIKGNAELIHLESLVARERILGEDNAEIPHPIIFRGAVYADTARFDKCTALWMRAMHLRFKNNRSVAKDLIRFGQVFAQMIHLGVGVDFVLVYKVLEFLLAELERNKQRLAERKNDDGDLQDALEYNIHTGLYLLVIMCKVKIDKESEMDLCRLVYRFLKMDLRLKSNNYTPLHMACDESTQVDDFHVSDVVSFPSALLARLLVKCGASVNALDSDRNTPLHTIVKYGKPISDFLTLHTVIMALVNSGAHIDMCNSEGKTPIEASTTGVAEIILRTQLNISLKCLCARAVKRNSIPYQGQVPRVLEEFVDMH